MLVAGLAMGGQHRGRLRRVGHNGFGAFQYRAPLVLRLLDEHADAAGGLGAASLGGFRLGVLGNGRGPWQRFVHEAGRLRGGYVFVYAGVCAGWDFAVVVVGGFVYRDGTGKACGTRVRWRSCGLE